MSVAVPDDEGSGCALPCVARTVAAVLLAIACAFGAPGHADEFEPLCSYPETDHRLCWNPVEVADRQGCHVFGHVSYFDHAPPMRWSGRCQDGRALGEGVLLDSKGNRAEGLLLDGLKEGQWTATLANRSVIMESHVRGVFHGPWTFDLAGGRFYAVHFEDGRMQGPWERQDADGYSEEGTMEDGRFAGLWTFRWPNGVEAVVPYEDGVIHGEIAVFRDGIPLGTLVHWKGRHVDGVLAPVPFLPDDP